MSAALNRKQQIHRSAKVKLELNQYMDYKNDLVASESIPVSSNTMATIETEEYQRKLREQKLGRMMS